MLRLAASPGQRVFGGDGGDGVLFEIADELPE
jgi:hypothetical protein